MATFKVIAGDFGQGGNGQVLVGRLYRASGQGFQMPKPGSHFQTEHIGMARIEALEIATEESLKKMGGSIGWGIAGALAAGPIGALAGVLAGGRKTEVTFTCRFKDGRAFLGSCNVKTFTAIQAAQFAVPAKTNVPATKAHPAFVLVMLALFIGAIVWFANLKPATPTAGPVSNLNQPSVKLVSDRISNDMQAMLLHDQNSAVWPREEDLLGWLRLNWEIAARQYESDYDENEIAADNNFKGKTLLVSGTVESIEKDFSDQGIITLRGSGLMGIRAQLSEAGMQGGASIHRGQQVGLVCTGSGSVLTVATLNDCRPLDTYLDQLSPSIESSVAELLTSGKLLGKANALPVVKMYVIGLHLGSDSPCLNGNLPTCESEIKTLMRDKAKAQSIEQQTAQMMSSLKLN